MKAIYSIAVSTALMATSFLSSADSSYKDVYQFGTGSPGEVTKSSNQRNSIGFAFDIYANNTFRGEKAELAVLESGETPRVKDVSSIPGYIGEY